MKLQDLEFKVQDLNIPQELIDDSNFIKDKIVAIQEILASNPGINDSHATQQWLAEFRIWTIELVIMYGRLKASYTRFSVGLLKQTIPENYKKFCNTEQKCEDYCYAHFPYTEEIFMLKPLVEKYFPQVSAEYNTLTSALKNQNKN